MLDMPDQFGSRDAAREYRDPRFAELDAQIQAANVDRQQRPAVRRHSSDLSRDIDTFAEQLKAKYSGRISNRPEAFKKRVLRLIAFRLPPYPRPGGRPRQHRVTRAAELYQQQREDMRQGRREHVNWLPIAQECIPDFQRIKAGARRCAMMQTLRNSVYVRLKRIATKKARRRSSHKQTPTSY